MRQRTPRRPRGSLYLSVLGYSLIVFVIGMASVITIRVQVRTAGMANDADQARLNARAAIELGMLYINTDPYWRTTRGNGAWFTNKPVAGGTMSLTAADPINGDITSTTNHPIILTAVGIKNQAVYKARVRLEVGPKTGSCLEVALQSGDDLNVSGGSTLAGNQTIASNHNVSGGTITANIEYLNNVNGSYATTPTHLSKPLLMPNAASVISSYTAVAAPISLASLTKSVTQPNLLTNPSFEIDASGWYLYTVGNAKLQRDSSIYKDGLYSLKVTSRNGVNNVAAQDIPIASILSGNSYTVTMPIYCTSYITVQASLLLTTSTGSFTFSTPAQLLNAFSWTDVKGTVSPSWTGTLTKATLLLTTTDLKTTYYMDKVTFQDITVPVGYYMIDRVLLSPSSNPFGSQTNPQGIYVLNCNGQKIAIMRSRIVGTLVLVNYDSNSRLMGAVCWEPAVANYPSLITDSSLTISTCAAALSEADNGVNFNPPGTPYPYRTGTANATLGDSFPSTIAGIVYVAGDLTISAIPGGVGQPDASPTFTGNVVAGGKFSVSNVVQTTVNYSNAAYTNPPPGFDVAARTMWDVPGTWERATN